MLHEYDNGICVTCEDNEPLDDDAAALLTALNELDGPLGDSRGIWDEAKHPRGPGGKFRSNVDKLKDAIVQHAAGSGEGHPFDGFDREQLRRVAKARGIELKRGEGRDSIAEKLLAHLGEPRVPPTAPEKTAERDPNPFGWIDDEEDGAASAAAAFDWINGEEPGHKAPPTDEMPEWLKAAVTTAHHEAPSAVTPKKKLDPKYLNLAASEHIRNDPDLVEQMKSLYEYQDGETGFHVRVEAASATADGIVINTTIHDRSGKEIGTADRRIAVPRNRSMLRQYPGSVLNKPVAEHTFLAIAPNVQGGGFSTRWLAEVEARYREEGVSRIILDADVDVGGYAWAKAGFGFASPGAGATIAKRSLPGLARIAPQDERDDARAMLDRIDRGYKPKPVELAMLGWRPGKTSWIGKKLMLASEWRGVKKL